MTLLLSYSIRISIVLGIGLVSLRFMRNQPAALRHLVLLSVALAALLLPAILPIMPPIDLPMPGKESVVVVQPQRAGARFG